MIRQPLPDRDALPPARWFAGDGEPADREIARIELAALARRIKDAIARKAATDAAQDAARKAA